MIQVYRIPKQGKVWEQPNKTQKTEIEFCAFYSIVPTLGLLNFFPLNTLNHPNSMYMWISTQIIIVHKHKYLKNLLVTSKVCSQYQQRGWGGGGGNAPYEEAAMVKISFTQSLVPNPSHFCPLNFNRHNLYLNITYVNFYAIIWWTLISAFGTKFTVGEELSFLFHSCDAEKPRWRLLPCPQNLSKAKNQGTG